MHFFTQISEHSTCTHLHHSDLDSAHQRYLEMTKKFSADAKTTCLRNSSELVQYMHGMINPTRVCNVKLKPVRGTMECLISYLARSKFSNQSESMKKILDQRCQCQIQSTVGSNMKIMSLIFDTS